MTKHKPAQPRSPKWFVIDEGVKYGPYRMWKVAYLQREHRLWSAEAYVVSSTGRHIPLDEWMEKH